MIEHFPPDEIALKLAASIGVGMLVGFEREWSNKDVGVRTFALISILGMICQLVGTPIALGGLMGVLLLLAVVNGRAILVDRNIEITTSSALLVTYVLGVLIGLGHLFTPVASCILMTMLLAWKMELQRFAGGVRPEEIRSAVLLGLIGFVIYPVLPNRFLDPWQLINPREAWITVIVVAALGFFNYVLLRLYSTRGLYWGAVLGGLVNSTATIAELSASLAASGLLRMIVVANLLTVLAMFIRNMVLLGFFAHAALLAAILPLAAMAAVAAIVLWRSRDSAGQQGGHVTLASPLSVRRVLEFGLFFLVIQALGTVATRKLGSLGFFAVSAAGGLFSSASSTVAAANLAARGSISPLAAGTGAVLASIASAAVNIPLVARQVKDREIACRVTLITAVQMAVGIGALVLQRYLLPLLR
jgi:uncharacterized membrane protein (DUF4010 family)